MKILNTTTDLVDFLVEQIIENKDIDCEIFMGDVAFDRVVDAVIWVSGSEKVKSPPIGSGVERLNMLGADISKSGFLGPQIGFIKFKDRPLIQFQLEALQ